MKFKVTLYGKKKLTAHLGEHKVITDQPITGGGDNEAPSPFTILLLSF